MNMPKKSAFYTLLLLLAISFSGCGNSENENAPVGNNNSAYQESFENLSEPAENESSDAVSGESSVLPPNYETYSDAYVSFEYDSNLLFYIQTDNSENPLVAVFCSSIPSDVDYVRSTQIGFLTIADSLSTEPSAFTAQLGLSTLTKTFCQSMFAPLEDETVVDENASYSDYTSEYYMELSDGSKCYTKTLNYNDHITLAIMCLCEYSSEYNDSFLHVYQSAKSEYGNYVISEETTAATPEPTKAPETAATPEPTKAPEAAATPEPTKAPEAAATPEPTKAPEAAPAVTTGQRDALKKAKSYLKYSAFSYNGLIGQLEYEGFSTEDATYAVDHCDADWDEQALHKAKSYLEHSAFSYKGLIDQLEYEEFTTSQATYGADHCGADWNEQAAKKGKSYLEFSTFSKSDLIDQLEYEGFTHDQAVYGAESNGL